MVESTGKGERSGKKEKKTGAREKSEKNVSWQWKELISLSPEKPLQTLGIGRGDRRFDLR